MPSQDEACGGEPTDDVGRDETLGGECEVAGAESHQTENCNLRDLGRCVYSQRTLAQEHVSQRLQQSPAKHTRNQYARRNSEYCIRSIQFHCKPSSQHNKCRYNQVYVRTELHDSTLLNALFGAEKRNFVT